MKGVYDGKIFNYRQEYAKGKTHCVVFTKNNGALVIPFFPLAS